MIFSEKSYEIRPYMYTAILDNGVTITAYEDGYADGSDGNRYHIVSHTEHTPGYEDDDVLDEVIVDGWEIVE